MTLPELCWFSALLILLYLLVASDDYGDGV